MLRVGVDTGGTFTDVALIDSSRGVLSVAKRLTTPEDPSVAVLEATAEALDNAGLGLADVDELIHGTTLASNVVLERKGFATALVTTSGFRDVLLIGRQKRYDIYKLDLEKPTPLIPRRRIFEATERMRADGSVEMALDRDEMRRIARELVASGIRSVAVCFLNSYANPEHELLAGKLLSEEAPGLMASLSAEVAPQWREYERANTTVVNAYVAPSVHAYIARLTEQLGEEGLEHGLLVMQSNGGVASAITAQQFPVRLIESGPAAGVIMAAKIAQDLDEEHVVSFDMGGTTAKISHVENGSPIIADAFEVDRVALKPRSGLPIAIPAIDLVEIGAGGGSIARVSSMRLITVGPESAGSTPGPICYARGGIEPTVTDADLVLGYLDPSSFAGGRMRLDVEAARAGIEERVAKPLDLDVVAAAWAIHELVNTNMIAAARTASIERGVDPRQSALVAFGGAGPVHAARLATGLGIERLFVPLNAGVASAFGLLAGDVKFDAARTHRLVLGPNAVRSANSIYDELERFVAAMVREAVGSERASSCVLSRSADMRYVGQGYEVRVPVPARALVASDAASLAREFASVYESLYGRSDGAGHVEVVNWRLEARLAAAGVGSAPRVTENGASERSLPVRQVYFPEAGGYIACPVYNRYQLRTGTSIEGPAMIEERDSTTVVLPTQVAELHATGNLIVTSTKRAG